MTFEKKINFRLEEKDYINLLRLCRIQDNTVSEIIRQAIKDYLYK